MRARIRVEETRISMRAITQAVVVETPIPVEEALIPVVEALIPVVEALIPVEEALILVEEALIPVVEALIPVEEALILVVEALILVEEALILVEEALILVEEALILVEEALILVEEALILVGEALILVEEALILVEEGRDAEFVTLRVKSAVELYVSQGRAVLFVALPPIVVRVRPFVTEVSGCALQIQRNQTARCAQWLQGFAKMMRFATESVPPARPKPSNRETRAVTTRNPARPA
jgi:hypothetical protein